LVGSAPEKCTVKNIHPIDQTVRLTLGIALLELAYFWLFGAAQVASYLAAAVMLATGSFRFCPLYRVLGFRPSDAPAPGTAVKAVVAVELLMVLVGGSYASVFLSRKVYLEEFNLVNDFYKQTLFLTGRGQRENANANYDKLLPAYQQFKNKYLAYRPFVLRSDSQLTTDLGRVEAMLQGVNALVRTGDLHQAHLDLEKVRPVFQDIFKRNGFSMLSVALVDFHDTMELMLDAGNAKDAVKTLTIYPQVNEKLQAVEAEANDPEIQAIRRSLEVMATLAKDHESDKLPAQAEVLKSSFIKVYLKRG